MTTTALGGVIKLKYTVQRIKHVRLSNAPFFFLLRNVLYCSMPLWISFNDKRGKSTSKDNLLDSRRQTSFSKLIYA